MQAIKHSKRQCTDQKRIEAFLSRERTGVIGIAGDAYAVPVNYLWDNGSIYFHGMGSGRKETLLSTGPDVCFTVYKEYGTTTDPVPCHADTAYMSVMVFGKAAKLVNPEEAAAALQKLVDKYLPGYYNYSLSGVLVEKYRSALDGNAVSVYRITPETITAKENPVEPGSLFGLEPDDYMV